MNLIAPKSSPDTATLSGFVDQVLKGLGQIMLQGNRWTGWGIIAGLAIAHWGWAAAGVLAAATGTLLARQLRWDAAAINDGLYGFSPALTGVALVVFFDNALAAWMAVPVGAALAASLQHIFLRRQIPAYTFPFIAVTWGIVFGLAQWLPLSSGTPAPLVEWPAWTLRLLTATNGYGQVIFQTHVLSGVLFCIGVAVSRPIAALYGLGASLLGAIVAVLLGQPFELVQSGFFGFNPVLTAIVFAGPRVRDGMWVMTGVLLTTGIHQFLVACPFLQAAGGALTFPFVVGTWLTLILQKFIRSGA